MAATSLTDLRRQLAYDVSQLLLGVPPGPDAPPGFVPPRHIIDLVDRLELFVARLFERAHVPTGLPQQLVAGEPTIFPPEPLRNAPIVQSGVFGDDIVSRGLAALGVTPSDLAIPSDADWESF